jgi:hypothetical protein
MQQTSLLLLVLVLLLLPNLTAPSARPPKRPAQGAAAWIPVDPRWLPQQTCKRNNMQTTRFDRGPQRKYWAKLQWQLHGRQSLEYHITVSYTQR